MRDFGKDNEAARETPSGGDVGPMLAFLKEIHRRLYTDWTSCGNRALLGVTQGSRAALRFTLQPQGDSGVVLVTADAVASTRMTSWQSSVIPN